MVAVVRNSLNLLAFLLGLSLSFIAVDSYAWDFDDTVNSMLNSDYTVDVRQCSDKWRAFASRNNVYKYVYASCYTCSATTLTTNADYVFPSTCPVPEPLTCSNGNLDPDELGLDCGGLCDNACDSSICLNQSAILSDEMCSEHTSPDAFGNCPSETTLIYTDDANVCATSPVPAIQYFSGDLQDPSGDVVDDGFFSGVDFPLSGVDDPFESGQLSIVESISPTSTVDNGNGTSTVTTTTTTTTTNNAGDVSTSTSTNSFNIDNGTGNKVDGTEQTITEDEIPMEATPLISAPDGLDFGDKLTDLLNSSSAEFEGYVDDVQGSDLVQHFTDVFTLPDDPGDSPLSISMGAYGVHLVDSQMMDTTLSLVGQVLVVCAFIAGAYIVFRKQ